MRNQITVLTTDLGSNLGWNKSVCTLRPNLHINVTDHGTICLDQLTNERMRRDYNEVYSRRRVRMMIYEEQLLKLTDLAKFDCFVTEDVFCTPNHITAFHSLVLYMEVLERIVNIDKHKRLYTIPPTSIKKYISDYGQADKTKVQEAVLNNPAISIKHPETATEHEFDSIACTWSFVQGHLLTLV